MVADASQIEYVRRQVDANLSSLKSSMKWYRDRTFYSQISTVVISAVITILAGLKSVPTSAVDAIQNAVLILGALSTVISAFGAFFSPRESWHLTAEVYGNLRALQANIEFAQSSADFSAQEDQIAARAFDEFQGIMKEYNARWQALRAKSK
jgi:hypothetical protein